MNAILQNNMSEEFKNYCDSINKINNTDINNDDLIIPNNYDKNFTLDYLNIKFYLLNNELYFQIFIFNKYKDICNSFVKNKDYNNSLNVIDIALLNIILINLPANIDYLIFNFTLPNYNIFDAKLLNLPLNLKKIKFNYLLSDEWYNCKKYSIIQSLVNEGMFNCLFYDKIPFGCEILINITTYDTKREINYKVSNFNEIKKELTLSSLNNNDKVNVKYINKKYSPYDEYDEERAYAC
jgi:hypothetical protein